MKRRIDVENPTGRAIAKLVLRTVDHVKPLRSGRTSGVVENGFGKLKRDRIVPLGCADDPATNEKSVMIKWIATQAVFVSDQNAAEDFWVNKVRFKVMAARDLGNELRWLEVAPPGAQSRLVIYPKSLMLDWSERRPSIVFECHDVDQTYEELERRGVEVGPSPFSMKWGKFASFKDPDGNEFGLKRWTASPR